MHKDGFVVCIKNEEGQVLREYEGGKVYLPFYQQYSLFFKNLRSQRAVVGITIDGASILGDNKLVIAGNDSMDLERFLGDGDLLKGRKLKFVPAVSNAQDPSSPDNGICIFSVQWEVPFDITIGTRIPPSGCIPWYGPYFYPSPFPVTPTTNKPFFHQNIVYWGNEVSHNSFVGGGLNDSNNVINSCSFSANLSEQATPTNKGVTVEGSKSNQAFSNVSTSWLAPEIVTLRLQLLAPEEKETFTVADTSKKHCTECGKKIKGNYKFCPKCGKKQED